VAERSGDTAFDSGEETRGALSSRRSLRPSKAADASLPATVQREFICSCDAWFASTIERDADVATGARLAQFSAGRQIEGSLRWLDENRDHPSADAMRPGAARVLRANNHERADAMLGQIRNPAVIELMKQESSGTDVRGAVIGIHSN
jgi:hypothetical protein